MDIQYSYIEKCLIIDFIEINAAVDITNNIDIQKYYLSLNAVII